MCGQYDEMLFLDWLRLSDALIGERRRESRRAMKSAAFTAYLIGAGGKVGWEEYCVSVGLAERRVTTTEQRQAEIRRAHEAVRRVEDAMNKKG